MTATYTAVFPLARRAQQFAMTIERDGWYAYDVERTGRTVTWEADLIPSASYDEAPDPGFVYLQDMLLTVGYYGSDASRRATLNGVRAPAS